MISVPLTENFPFEITVEDVLRFLGPEAHLYSDDSRVFLRELIQNALDAVIVRANLTHNCAASKTI